MYCYHITSRSASILDLHLMRVHKISIFRGLAESKLPILFGLLDPFGADRNESTGSRGHVTSFSLSFIVYRINFAGITVGYRPLSRNQRRISEGARSRDITHTHIRRVSRPSTCPRGPSRTLACNPSLCSPRSRTCACVRRTGDRSNGAEADSYYSRDLK